MPYTYDDKGEYDDAAAKIFDAIRAGSSDVMEIAEKVGLPQSVVSTYTNAKLRRFYPEKKILSLQRRGQLKRGALEGAEYTTIDGKRGFIVRESMFEMLDRRAAEQGFAVFRDDFGRIAAVPCDDSVFFLYDAGSSDDSEKHLYEDTFHDYETHVRWRERLDAGMGP